MRIAAYLSCKRRDCRLSVGSCNRCHGHGRRQGLRSKSKLGDRRNALHEAERAGLKTKRVADGQTITNELARDANRDSP